MQITEIYKSIQGESTLRGAAVHLRASDGMQSALLLVRQRIHLHGRPRMTLEEVSGRSSSAESEGGLVEITGGEPMLQEREVVPLMQRLLDDGYTRAARNQRRASAGAGSERRGQDRGCEVSALGRRRIRFDMENLEALDCRTMK